VPVGGQTTEDKTNNTLTSLAVTLRELMDDILHQQGFLTKLGNSGLQALGYSASEATQVLDDINHMATVAGCYKGTVQQGGTGGTGAILFNFEDFLTHLWGGS